MPEIAFLMGKSSSGKDNIFKALVGDKELNLKTVIMYTTRPMRAGEKEGVEYYYVDNDKGLALVIVDEPGTYEVCSYDNGNRIYYGTVTVTDKNVSCALTAE